MVRGGAAVRPINTQYFHGSEEVGKKTPTELPGRAEPHHIAGGCLPKEGIVAEIGTFYGHFAKEILHITRPKQLHLFDLSFDRLEREHFMDGINAGQVYLHQADSAEALEELPDYYFDWIYIDGNHTSGGVKRDIAVSIRKIKPDGFLVFNDYIYWSHFELVEYGVVHAVNELCIEGRYEILFFALDTLMYCDVVLRKMQ